MAIVPVFGENLIDNSEMPAVDEVMTLAEARKRKLQAAGVLPMDSVSPQSPYDAAYKIPSFGPDESNNDAADLLTSMASEPVSYFPGNEPMNPPVTASKTENKPTEFGGEAGQKSSTVTSSSTDEKPVNFLQKMVSDPETYAQTILPIMGIIEAIGSHGTSPGTTAMGQQKAIFDTAERKRTREKAEEEARYVASQRALEKKLRGDLATIDWSQPGAYELAVEAAMRSGSPKDIIDYGEKLATRKAEKVLTQEDFDYIRKNLGGEVNIPFYTQNPARYTRDRGTLESGKAMISGGVRMSPEEQMQFGFNKLKYAADLATQAAGERKLITDKAALAAAAGDMAKRLVPYQQLVKYIPASGTGLGLAQQGWANVKQFFGQEDPIQALQNYNGVMTSIIARRVGAEKGSMAEGDVARAKKMLLNTTDTPKMREFKTMILESMTDPNVSWDDVSMTFEDGLAKMYGGQAPAASSSGTQLPSPKTQQEYLQIPAGSKYIDTDGKIKIKG